MTVSTPPRRNLPYLQRTWNQGISGATSGATRQPGSRNGVNGVDAGHEDRPLKRFKLAGDVTPNVTQPPSR
ncbi:hypothetical protein IMZ48_26340, partial [Candidatus Bathyarchaeota archaeon]|nr:hypothetical protein [Candidatus Bathyarchaeota archaeon]